MRKHDVWRVPALEPRLPHPFMMVRAAAMAEIGGYRHVLHAEDTDLCWRLLEMGEIRNLEELLGEYSVHDESISSKSARNGRLQAVFSQLAILAARRRLKGRGDIQFSPERCRQAAASAASFAELTEFAGRAYGLNHGEKKYLAVGSIVKYLQHAKTRPYELESVDTQFALSALPLGLQVDVDPRTYRTIRGTYRQTFKRMVHLSRYQDALQLFFASPRYALFKPLIRAPQI